MRRIFKYEVPVGVPPVQMPVGAVILSAGLQDGATNDQVYVWALVDPKNPLEPRYLDYHYTGSGIPEPFTFIATLQTKSETVYHVVEYLKQEGKS